MKRSEDEDYRGAIDRLFRNARHSRHSSVLEDPRVRVIPTDGRNYILATPKYYDVITAEPSNPWIAGIANLYTREFYSGRQIEDQRRRHLRPVVSQLFDVAGRFSHGLSHLRRSVSPCVVVEHEGKRLSADRQQEGAEVSTIRRSRRSTTTTRCCDRIFEYLGLSDVYAVQGFYRMGRDGFLAFSKGARINTDDGAQLEFSAPKNLRRATTELNRRIMTPFLVDSPPWLKTKPLAGFAGDASFLHGAILRWRAWRVTGR